MKLFIITPAFCPAVQLARSLLSYRKSRNILPARHIVVDCHYPINEAENSRDIKLIVDSYGEAELWDSKEDLGSAQTQNWVLEELIPDFDEDSFFINLDPDAACPMPGWDSSMLTVLLNDEKCILASCNAPMIDKFKESRHQTFEEAEISGVKILLPDIPTPFNLSMWRINFLRTIGGIPQRFPYYGEVEGPMYATARAMGYYNCYLKDYYENEDGKLMHHTAFESWKDAHARTTGPDSFLGNFKEYCLTKGLL